MRPPLLLPLRHQLPLVLRHLSPDRTGLFWSKIERFVLLISVEYAKLLSLCGRNDGMNASYGFPNVVTRV